MTKMQSKYFEWGFSLLSLWYSSNPITSLYKVILAHRLQILPIPQCYLMSGPIVPYFLPACLFKVVFVYTEAQLSETCAGSVLASFHRGSILFLIKWHSVAGGLAGTQLPGKPKNAGLHLATNSYCLRRLVLHSGPQYYFDWGLYMCMWVCVSLWNGATAEGVRYGGSLHSYSLVDVC